MYFSQKTAKNAFPLVAQEPKNGQNFRAFLEGKIGILSFFRKTAKIVIFRKNQKN